jgi:hypothetical protein
VQDLERRISSGALSNKHDWCENLAGAKADLGGRRDSEWYELSIAPSIPQV